MSISGPGPIPAQALRYFRGKIAAPAFDWRDIWRVEHAHAFTVAKAVQLDILTDIRSALDDALAQGQTLREFSKNLTPVLQEKGWWGRSLMEDPLSGETRAVQLGSPRRLKTIYRANLRTARAAGQWERAQRTKAALPYLLYELGPSREHREEHVAWHGTLLPVDDPWWDAHMPPNGWGCKCRVRQVAAAEAERLQGKGVPLPAHAVAELDPATGKPTGHRRAPLVPVKTAAPRVRLVRWENKRTGRTEMVPRGIDPGWDTNPGKVRQKNMEKVLSEKMAGLPQEVIAVAKQDIEDYRKNYGEA